MSGVYVAIGDSMSIDDYAGGPGRGAASLLHRNRDSDFPDWAGRDLATYGVEAQILARDGATVIDVLQRQLPLITQAPVLATVTMGGNDLMGAYGDNQAAHAAIGRVTAIGEAILLRLRALCGTGGRVVLTTVYDPSDGTGQVPGSGLQPWPEGPILVRALNAALVELAGRHDAIVADVHGHFLGHGVHGGDPAAADSRPANRNLWYCGVIEPNAWGANEIRAAWWDAVTHGDWLPPS
ncbi:GDSL-type esterase/lipase family protein [Phytohabitans aurantiacus]|uniref:GDSL-type esterase/lipase family protein n=1 Tax=Phytohabitans aurantiacus TaxID=3016789 RepID=UPI002493066A|nr:GDSL-type esterase/lipase family protein [Phytohabitans aurantiacus]